MTEDIEITTLTYLVGPYKGDAMDMVHTLYAVNTENEDGKGEYLQDLTGDMGLLERVDRLSFEALVFRNRLKILFTKDAIVNHLSRRFIDGRVEIHNRLVEAQTTIDDMQE